MTNISPVPAFNLQPGETPALQGFTVHLAGPSLDFAAYQVHDPIITGIQLLELAGHYDRESFQVVQLLPSGETEHIRLSETIDLRLPTPARVLVFRSDRLFGISVESRAVLWGEPRICGMAILLLTGKSSDEVDVWLDQPGGSDRVIEPDEYVSLKGSAAERFVTRPISVRIRVNTRPEVVHKRRLTYMEVAKLAYPNGPFGPQHVYTIQYTGGPSQNSAGLLVEGSSVHIKNGMRFDVAYTDKS